MTPAAVTGFVMVPLYGAVMCTVPAITRPTLQFGVRVPPAYTGAAIIRRERRAYYWRSATVAVCSCAAVATIGWGSGPWWLTRVIQLLEIAADVCCFRLARNKIIAVKTSERWFAGLRQTVVADTSWRTQPRPFPVRWLIPAIAVTAATTVIGVTRYPDLPAHLTTLGGHPVPRSPVRAFALVVSQLYVTGMWTGLMVLIYRARPDIDAADPAASLRSYRRILDGYTKAVLTLLALIDLTFLLAALQLWQLYRLHGTSAALPLLPAAAGLFILTGFAMRAGRGRVRAAGGGERPGLAAPVGRDDDRFWKAGVVYINGSDPAIMVSARVGVGWTLNLGNPAAQLIMAAIIATPAGLAVISIAAGG
jgi:uncharacterized membrane protein